jgi:UDP-N-acetyl-D-glucosamine dehydrogenase
MTSQDQYSISPTGEKFALPKQSEYAAEFERLKKRSEEARAEGKEVVVVLGVGFVGAVMASVVADTVDKNGHPSKFVIGCDLPGPSSYWKIPIINSGKPPVKAEDPEVYEVIGRVVNEKKTLTATYNNDCLSLADVVVVDVQCDFHKKELGNMRSGDTDMAALEAAIKTIGEKIQPHCLTLIETTVAPGTTELVAWPIMKKAFKKRGIKSIPLLSHSYERVMPGREYVSSIRDFWRVCSGCDQEAKARVEKFLREVLNTDEYPLTVLDRPIESETSKIVENSYRASILAFMNEWSLFAERNGVDLVKVYQAIKMRPTHSNIMFPGPGVGGYCLPKDGGLGYWAYEHILGFNDGDDVFKITPSAIDINDTRALHVAELTRDALRNIDIHIAGSDILICGASYRQDVGDTRYSGSELVLRRIKEMGGEVAVHDPYVDNWVELEHQDTFPNSWSQYFRKQDELKELKVKKDLKQALKDVEAMILAVPHQEYMNLNPDDIVKWAGQPLAIIDCFGILDDAKIKRYFELGCEVKGLGRGHIQHIKKEVLRK